MPHPRSMRRGLQFLSRPWHVGILCALMVSGCSKTDPTEMERLYREWTATTVEGGENWVLAPNAEQLPTNEQAAVQSIAVGTIQPSQYWQFSDDTRLVCLPGVGDESDDNVPATSSLGKLLSPTTERPIAAASVASIEKLESCEELTIEMPKPVVDEASERRRRRIEIPAPAELSAEEQHLLKLIERETLSATTGAPTDKRLDEQCRQKIGSAFQLSQRGAAYAARKELIEILRLISQAKDDREQTRSHTASLAAGLRALEEAEDFMPRGSQLEADMKLSVICAAHRTPVSRELDLGKMLPSQMTERYNRYAQIKLAHAVAGEPAGSMALYALGKLNSQLAASEPEQSPHATRRGVAFQQASLLAHNENYMAAHELGVLLAESGHYPEARHLLAQVASEQPNAVVYRNLARVQEALGRSSEAMASRAEAQRLAQLGRGPRSQVSWVSPQDFSRSQTNTFAPQMAARPTSVPSPQSTMRR